MAEETITPTRRICATAEVHHRLLEDPEYQRRRMRVENFALRAVPLTGVVDVDVVVHIVLKNPTVITDAQVRTQIDVLNEDYSARNADVTSVPSVWTGTVGNAEIRFNLAKKDPSGNSTSGITRTTTSVSSFSTDDSVKFAGKGGQDAWDTARYLNFWVCVLSGGNLNLDQLNGLRWN